MTPQTRTTTLTRRLRAASRSAWWGSRARNVLTRKARLTAFFVPLYTVVLASVYVLPRGATEFLAALRTDVPAVLDTAPLRGAEQQARERLNSADSELEGMRQRLFAARSESTLVRSLSSTPQIDSLREAIRTLDVLIARASEVPLPETYRALAESPAMRADAKSLALLDSLSDIERERDEFGAGAAVDPVFVSLTTRASALGRAIVAAASDTRTALRRDLAAAELLRTPAPVAAAPLPDTMPAALTRDSAFASLTMANRALKTARLANRAAQSAAAQARNATQLAPDFVLMTGSAVLAAALLFALALGEEARAPRVADHNEAEHVADARVLSVVGARVIPPQTMRRAADRERPFLLDPQLDAYRMLAWHIGAQPPHDGILVVTGDAPLITAAVAANIAAVLANEARAVLLLDVDFDRGPVADVLQLPNGPGIASVVENKRRWPETIVQVIVGRGRTLDCITAGSRSRPLGPAEREALSAEIQRAARRYDITVVHAPIGLARRALTGCDALVCAKRSSTRISTLSKSVEGLREDGARILGIALWEGRDVKIAMDDGRRSPDAAWAKRGSNAA